MAAGSCSRACPPSWSQRGRRSPGSTSLRTSVREVPNLGAVDGSEVYLPQVPPTNARSMREADEWNAAQLASAGFAVPAGSTLVAVVPGHVTTVYSNVTGLTKSVDSGGIAAYFRIVRDPVSVVEHLLQQLGGRGVTMAPIAREFGRAQETFCNVEDGRLRCAGTSVGGAPEDGRVQFWAAWNPDQPVDSWLVLDVDHAVDRQEPPTLGLAVGQPRAPVITGPTGRLRGGAPPESVGVLALDGFESSVAIASSDSHPTCTRERGAWMLLFLDSPREIERWFRDGLPGQIERRHAVDIGDGLRIHRLDVSQMDDAPWYELQHVTLPNGVTVARVMVCPGLDGRIEF